MWTNSNRFINANDSVKIKMKTDQNEKTGQQEIDQVPQEGRKPKVEQIDTADFLHMFRLDGGLRYKQQSKGAGQGGHTIHQIDGDGKACFSPTDERKN